jgi:hypothetical protein
MTRRGVRRSARKALADAARGPEYQEPPEQISDAFALGVSRRLAERGITNTVPGTEDERTRMRQVIDYLKQSRELERLDAERRAAATPEPLPPTTADIVRRELLKHNEAANAEQSAESGGAAALNSAALLRAAIGRGNHGSINGEPL